MDGKSTLQQISTLAIIREISDSDLEIGRYNLKSGVWSPNYPGELTALWIITRFWETEHLPLP